MPFQALQIELTGQSPDLDNRPDLHNAFDEILIAELTAACIALDETQTSASSSSPAGTKLLAGADLNWMKRAANNASMTTSMTPAALPSCCAR